MAGNADAIPERDLLFDDHVCGVGIEGPEVAALEVEVESCRVVVDFVEVHLVGPVPRRPHLEHLAARFVVQRIAGLLLHAPDERLERIGLEAEVHGNAQHVDILHKSLTGSA
jgi:hypothetical protein